MQENWVDWPDCVNDRVGNIMLSRIMGAEVRLDPAGFGIGFKDSWNEAIEDVKARGGTPYAIPAGASDHRLGGLGFAHWAEEVQQQEEELGVFFDTIVVCAVTGSTQAGMIAGFAAQDRPRRVIGIDASAKLAETRDQVARIARRYGGPDRPRPRPARRGDRGRSRAGPATSTASRSRPRSTRSGSPASSRG